MDIGATIMDAVPGIDPARVRHRRRKRKAKVKRPPSFRFPKDGALTNAKLVRVIDAAFEKLKPGFDDRAANRLWQMRERLDAEHSASGEREVTMRDRITASAWLILLND